MHAVPSRLVTTLSTPAQPATRGWRIVPIALPAWLLVLLLAGCDGGTHSRFDQVAGVDVCQLISSAEAEHILGPALKTPTTEASGGGIAGNCTWTFKQLSSGEPASLSVMMTTRASAGPGLPPARFLAASEAEIAASLGAEPWPLDGLGDRALLFQTRRPEHSELYVLQSETLLSLRIMGGSAAQMEQFARALSREIAIPATPSG
jgi:hypothetical protein